MRIAVLGAGAIGAYVGAALARGGADVQLIARGENLAALRRDGIRVKSPRGDFEAHPPATDNPAEVGPVDLVFLGLKANCYPAAGPLLGPAAAGDDDARGTGRDPCRRSGAQRLGAAADGRRRGRRRAPHIDVPPPIGGAAGRLYRVNPKQYDSSGNVSRSKGPVP